MMMYCIAARMQTTVWFSLTEWGLDCVCVTHQGRDEEADFTACAEGFS